MGNDYIEYEERKKCPNCGHDLLEMAEHFNEIYGCTKCKYSTEDYYSEISQQYCWTCDMFHKNFELKNK